MNDPNAVTDDETAEEKTKPKLALEVKVETPSSCERRVIVTIPREDIERYFKDAFDELKPKAEVPGFRPGRAPRKLVETRFREQVTDQVKGSLLMDAMTQVNEDEDFSAISEPDLDIDAVILPDEGPMHFEFLLEVRPEFEMPQWKGLKLNRLVHDVTDSEVEERLKLLLARYGSLVPVEDEDAQAGDFVVVNATFHHDGEQLSKLTERTIEIKSALSFPDGRLEDFEQLMVGVRFGQTREAKVKLTDSVEQEALRGAEVDVRFEVLDVKRLEIPELNQEFLDKIGGFDDEQELKDLVGHELSRQFHYRQQQHLRQQITSQLTADADWELPPHLVQRQSRRELERVVLEMQSSGFSTDEIQQYANRIQQSSIENTRMALKEHFILERIAEDEDIEANAADYDVEIERIADQENQSPRRVRARLEKRGQMDTLRNQIIERRVIETVQEHAEFTDEPYEPADRDETVAVGHEICDSVAGSDIPKAKHGGDAQSLREPADHT